MYDFFPCMAMKASPEEILQKYLELEKTHHHPLPKPDKDITRKLQTDIPYEEIKNPQQILVH